ncbi:BBE domain-containing protein [Haladaptatus sp. R4]|uniref:BBE domain-containing protein n=1 Tax=Haladaptatus sp. R4 TaxID=1679489 RepID=UPI0009ED7F17
MGPQLLRGDRALRDRERGAELPQRRGGQRVRVAYDENYERLQEHKDEYDPDNIFRVNQNIELTN